ncbi:MAG: histidine phosphatase family protein [Candidatus Ornithospirochaeta sp.]
MGRIYFVRHGESQWNVENRICGSMDSPLTDKGREQARETGGKILSSGIKVDMIFSSPLSRARETAEIISQIISLPVTVDDRIRGQAFGEWEGVSPRNKDEFKRAKECFCLSYNGGESMLKCAQRVYNFLDEVLSMDKTCLMVAHNGIARFVNSYFSDMSNKEFASFAVPNCSITVFEK